MTETSERAPRTGILIVLALSLALKLVVLFLVGEIRPLLDEVRYLEAGASIAAGEGIVYSVDTWDEFHAPPFYPYFLGLVHALGGGALAAKFVQVLVSTLSVWLLYLLGRRWFGHRAAFWGAALCAFYPNLIAFTHYNWVETFFLFWFYTALLCLFERQGGLGSRGRVLSAGLLLGVSSLCRAEVVYVLPLLVLWIYFVTRDLRTTLQRGGLLVTGCVAVLLPWQVHIQRELGGFLPITSASANVWYLSYNAFEPMNQDLGITADEFRKPYRKEARPKVESDDLIFRNQRERELAFEFIAEHPLLCAKRFVQRVVLLLNPTSFLIRHLRDDNYTRRFDERAARPQIPPRAEEALVWSALGSYALLSVLAVLGLFALPPGRPRSLILLLLFYFISIYALTYAISRYRLTIVPLLALVAGYTLADPRACLARLRSPARAIGVVGVLVFLGLAWSVHFHRLWPN